MAALTMAILLNDHIRYDHQRLTQDKQQDQDILIKHSQYDILIEQSHVYSHSYTISVFTSKTTPYNKKEMPRYFIQVYNLDITCLKAPDHQLLERNVCSKLCCLLLLIASLYCHTTKCMGYLNAS